MLLLLQLKGSYTVTIDGDIVVSSDDSDFIVKDHPFVVTLRPTTKGPTPLPTIRITRKPSPRPTVITRRPTPQPTIKPPISFKSFIGSQFFRDERSNEASQELALH